MELRVPHVTSYARAPSSLLFLRSARYPPMPRFLQFLREFWPMPLPLMIHSALALFAQRTRVPTSSRSTGFCVIWVCISSSSQYYGTRIHVQTCAMHVKYMLISTVSCSQLPTNKQEPKEASRSIRLLGLANLPGVLILSGFGARLRNFCFHTVFLRGF